ncbi:MAG: ATP-binding protein [Alphaproteobacteria bacterium]|nr:ATP-binding protein [Alphaproteobacteria bacterium]
MGDYKRTTRAGDQYQDLLGIDTIKKWLEDKDQYEYLEFEASEADDIDVKGLDDIIAKRANGRFELIQSKFTVDANQCPLTFEWLLEQKGAGKSLLQKWAEPTLEHFDNNTLHFAILKTNRTPDKEFFKALNIDNKLDINLIPDDIKIRMEAQVENLENFCKNFTFEHSRNNLIQLKNKLKRCFLEHHTDEAGWHRLQNKITEWSTEKYQPAPDGKIQYKHIQSILTTKRPVPLKQDFIVPANYQPPDDSFHDKILDRLKRNGCTVIYGTPGIGKSTYISYLFNHLKQDKKNAIRHHFFLSLGDKGGDRTAYDNVANSLKQQLAKQIKISASETIKLNDVIAQANTAMHKENQILYIIIDGLDHVWRENEDIGELNRLFRELLPSRSNIHLIIGTQKVSNNQLPQRLKTYINESDWFKLSHMSESAVTSYLKDFFEKGYIIPLLDNDGWQPQKIRELSSLIYQKTKGHPLHLYYTIEYVKNSDDGFSRDSISDAPECPDGDINIYYRNLLQRLSYEAKELLDLIASCMFYFPDEESFYECLEDTTEYRKAFMMIKHMLITQKTSIYPFHESILVFIRRQDNYRRVEKRFLPKVRAWLENDAPPYWQWAYLWIIEARLGKPENIIIKPDREWLIDACAKAYPYNDIDNILGKAEEEALKKQKFSELIKLRHIRWRFSNCHHYSPYEDIECLSLVLSLKSRNDDNYILDWMADNLNQVNTDELPIIAIQLGGDNKQLQRACLDEVNSRLQFDYQFPTSERQEFKTHFSAIMKIVANTKIASITKFVDYIKVWNVADDLFQEFLEYALLSNITEGAGEEILALWGDEDLSEEFKFILSDFTARYFLKHNINIKNRPEAENLKFSYIGQCVLLANHIDFNDYQLPQIYIMPSAIDINWGKFLESFFYEALSVALRAQGDFSYMKPLEIQSKYLQDIYHHICEMLQKLARYIAYHFKNSSVRLNDITFFYNFLAGHDEPPRSGDTHKILPSVYPLLINIAFYCSKFIISSAQPSEISDADYKNLIQNTWFNQWQFTNLMVKYKVKWLNPATAKNIIEERNKKFINDINEQGELYRLGIEFAQFALLYDFNDYATSHIQRALKASLGYGERKDIAIFEVMDAITYCAEYKNAPIAKWLKQLVPIVNNISEFTDGSETRHAPHEFIALIAQFSPNNLVSQLQYYLQQEDWHFCEDIFKNIIEMIDLTQADSQAFTRTIFQSKPLQALQEKADNNDVMAKQLLEEQIVFLGGFPDIEKENGYRNNLKNKEIDIDFNKYPADKLDELRQHLKENNIYGSKEYFSGWISYWVSKRKGLEIIATIEQQLQKRKLPHDIRDILWQIFELVIDLQGKEKAFEWGVRAVGYGHDWQHSFFGGKPEHLDKIAELYPERWLEFINKTSKVENFLSSEKAWLQIGSKMLVYFLLKVGKTKYAYAITEAMIENVENDTEHLALPPAKNWVDSNADINIPFQALLAMLAYPIEAIKIRTAQQIAALLKPPHLATYKPLFLKNLSQCTLEMDVCTYLVALGLSGKPPSIPLEEMQGYIFTPSILSENMLEMIYNQKKQFHSWVNRHSIIAPIDFKPDVESNRIRNNEKSFIDKTLSDYEKETGLELIPQFHFEWQQLWQKHDGQIFSSQHYSFNPKHFQKISKIGVHPRQEDISESAYLRTLAFAYSKLDEPIETVKEKAKAVQLVDFNLAQIEPQPQPKIWQEIIDNLQLDNLNEQWLDIIAKNILSNTNELPLTGVGRLLENEDCIIELEFHAILVDTRFENQIEAKAIFDALDPFMGFDIPEEVIMLTKGISRILEYQTYLFLDKLYLPSEFLVQCNKHINIEGHKGGITIYNENKICGEWLYWNHQFEPIYRAYTKGSVCSLLAMKRSLIPEYILPYYKLQLALKLYIHKKTEHSNDFEKSDICHLVDIS